MAKDREVYYGRGDGVADIIGWQLLSLDEAQADRCISI